MTIKRHLKIVDDDKSTTLVDTGLKVAFATTDMKHVNQHFGSAESFAIYAINLDGHQLIEAAQFGKLEQDGNEDKLAAKIAMLEGCAAVYCQAVGSSAVRQLVAHGIQPVKVSEGADVSGLIEALKAELSSGPTAWLARAIDQHKVPDKGRFNEMAQEGWDE